MPTEGRQKVQAMGRNYASGDYPVDIATNISGQLLVDIEVEVASGLVINTDISGQAVTVSGDHIYVESGVSVMAWVSGIVEVIGGLACLSGSVSIDSGLIGVTSGLIGVISGTIQLDTSESLRVSSLKTITTASGGEEICGEYCSGPVHSVIVKSLSGNNDIFIGGSNCKPYSGYGFMLANQEAVTIDVANVCDIWACANVSGELITYIGADY